MLKITDLSLGYEKENMLLLETNLSLDSGLWLLEGANGCGKSTLLQLLAYGINEKDVSWTVNPEVILERPEKIIYLDSNTTIPNVIESDCAEFIFKLNDVEVKDYIPIHNNRKLNSYSTGELKAAVLHIISYLNPELLLLDEYIGNFDDNNLETIFGYLTEMTNRGTLIIAASNENDIKRRFANTCKIKNKKIEINTREASK